MKQIVRYRRGRMLLGLRIGEGAFIQTLDHPSPLVTNWPAGDGYVQTSPIVRIENTGIFETENTIYYPENI